MRRPAPVSGERVAATRLWPSGIAAIPWLAPCSRYKKAKLITCCVACDGSPESSVSTVFCQTVIQSVRARSAHCSSGVIFPTTLSHCCRTLTRLLCQSAVHTRNPFSGFVTEGCNLKCSDGSRLMVGDFGGGCEKRRALAHIFGIWSYKTGVDGGRQRRRTKVS